MLKNISDAIKKVANDSKSIKDDRSSCEMKYHKYVMISPQWVTYSVHGNLLKDIKIGLLHTVLPNDDFPPYKPELIIIHHIV